MVDAHALSVPLRVAKRRASGPAQVSVHEGRDTALAIVDALPSDVLCSGYQSPAFLRAWLRHTPHTPVFITMAAEGAGRLLLPLERVSAGVLAYPGERHANGNFPVGRPEDIAALGSVGEAAIVAALRAARPDGHAIVLERQLTAIDGIANPFVFARSSVSPNPALSLSLEGGFEAVLARHSGKRKRKRFRGQERDFEDMGGYTYVPLVATDRIEATLDRCLELKAHHFREAGIHDVFAGDHVRAFFTDFFLEGARQDPPTCILKTIESKGMPVAISACTSHSGALTVEFSTYDPEYRDCSPGDMLFYLSIRETADGGFDIYDFGVGDEPFKRAWCEIETWQRDTVIPLTARGHAYAAAKVVRSTMVRELKRNKALWNTAKKLRKAVPILRLGDKPSAED